MRGDRPQDHPARPSTADPGTDATLAAPGVQPGTDATLAAPGVQPGTDATLASPGVQPSGVITALTPEIAGRYHYEGGKNQSILGRGGIGAVFLAMDHHVGREVAVKELLEGVQGSLGGTPSGSDAGTVSAATSRFLREARITGQLQHPNIVPVHEIGQRADGTLYYTMKVVRGKTLRQAMKGCATLKDRLKYLGHVEDICQAIAYAHHKGIIHRDIKPDNVMVGEFGETVVLDWGLAKTRGKQDLYKRRLSRQIPVVGEQDLTHTVSGSAVGTPAYMSPEQAAGDIDAIDEQSDVWSLGAVLYELLTGRPPFLGKSVLSIIENVKTAPLVPVRERCPEAPPDLAAVADKALQRDKAQRYRSARQVADDIGAFQSGARVAAYEYNSWELAKRFVGKNKAVTALLFALLASLVVGSVIIYGAYKNALHAERRARTARARAEHNERLAHYNYALSMATRARRQLAARNHLAARIFAAQSLIFNPYNPYSPHRFGDAKLRAVPQAARRLARSHSVLYQATAHQRVTYRRTLWGHTSNINDLRFSPDGRWLLSASWDSTARLWNPQNGQPVATLKSPAGPTDRLWAAAFAPDGKTLAMGGTGKVVQLWDLTTRRPTVALRGHAHTVHALAFSPDGKLLASASEDRSVRLWTVPGTGKASQPPAAPRILAGHTATVTGVAFSPDGLLMASASRDRTVRLWRVADSTAVRTLTGHENRVWSVAFSPDGKTLASASWDKTVRLWRVSDGVLLTTLRGHEGPVYSVRFSRDGQLLVSGSGDHSVRLWSVHGGQLLSTVKNNDDWAFSAALSPDGKTLASGNGDKNIKLWQVTAPKRVRRLRGHTDTVFTLACSPDGTLLASGSGDRSIGLWRTTDRTSTATLKGHGGPVRFVAFSPDGKSLASASYDNTARLWDVATKTHRATLTGHADRVYSLAFSPNGQRLATASWDKTVRLWDVRRATAVKTLGPHKRRVWSVTFSPDGRTLLSAGFDRFVRRWTGTVHEKMTPYHRYPDQITSVRYSPDGKLVASASRDASIELRNAATGKLVRKLLGHKIWVNRVRFSRDGRTLLSGADDRTARLWDVRTGHLLQTLQLSALGLGIAYCPGSKQLAVNDGRDILLYPVDRTHWKRDPHQLLETAQREAGLLLHKGNQLVPRHKKPPR